MVVYAREVNRHENESPNESPSESSSFGIASRHIRKSHNVSRLLYHLICPTKYRRAVIDAAVDSVLREICLEIAERREITFLEIGTDRDHVHFLIQSVPTYSPTQIARTVKSLTAREVFHRVPAVKKALWGGAFWTSGFFINTVGHQASESIIRRYVREQGREPEYRQLHLQALDHDHLASPD